MKSSLCIEIDERIAIGQQCEHDLAVKHRLKVCGWILRGRQPPLRRPGPVAGDGIELAVGPGFLLESGGADQTVPFEAAERRVNLADMDWPGASKVVVVPLLQAVAMGGSVPHQPEDHLRSVCHSPYYTLSV
jgi:hypothetical protein